MKQDSRRQFFCRTIAALLPYILLSGCRPEQPAPPIASTSPLPSPPMLMESPSLALPSPKGAVLKGRQNAEIVFKQCSRNTPQKVDGYWNPAPEDISRLEAAAQDQLWKVPREKTAVRMDRFYRQYVGFTRAGHHFIYVNAFSDHILSAEKERWKTEPVDVCDGGSSFWGVEYDVEAQKFLNFAVNGFV